MGNKPGGKWVHRLSDKDLDAGTGVCAVCGLVKLTFKGPNRTKPHCSEQIREMRAKYPAGSSDNKMQPHGLTAGQARLAVQGKACELCGTTTDLVVDHDHRRRKRRGVLCRLHNAALGAFGDDPELLRLGAEYLIRWAASNDEAKDEPADNSPPLAMPA